MPDEQALVFSCGGARMYGVLTLPDRPAGRGVLVVVGGAQYRAGSHRQFTLLARSLAARGIPVLRFDYRGMGDSEGEARSFETVGDDLRAAIDEFFVRVPSLREVALWGLCDGASAAAFYAAGDPRVTGVALLNPWVRTEAGIARATLTHYYGARLMEPAFWRKVLGGHFNLFGAARSFWSLACSAAGRHRGAVPAGPAPTEIESSLPERMYAGLAGFGGQVLVITSGNDLTAREFAALSIVSRPWRRLLAAPRVRHHELLGADHTFSRRTWRDQVAAWTADWIASW